MALYSQGRGGEGGTHSHELALRGNVGGSLAEPQLGLQRVEVCLQLSLLVSLWGLGVGGVGAELFHAGLRVGEVDLGRPVVEPRQGLLDPLQQLREGGGVVIITQCIQSTTIVKANTLSWCTWPTKSPSR